ncbi:MAG: FecR domain-containing protein [Anaerolineae bacterium]|nr:FecR domain-containing protein [Anaerolineae bacterium]
MKRIVSALLLLSIGLGACASEPSASQSDSTDSAAPAESTLTENSDPVAAAREAVVSEFENEVVVRAASEGEFVPAESGFVIQTGGALQTGADGRARVDIKPEGTIVRVAPNSAFTLPQITEENGEPKTTLSLFFGKIFVLLNGGSLDVETPSGVASVRGSLLSVSVDPARNRLQAVCLEGHCALENENGDSQELEEGQSAYVDENGELFELEEIDQDEIQDWLDEAPELGEFLEELPDPESFPEIEEFEEFNFDPEAFFEEPANEEDGIFPLDDEALPDDAPAPGDDPLDDGGGDGEDGGDTDEGGDDGG